MQQGRLAGPRRTDERNDFAWPQRDIDAIQHPELGPGKPENAAHIPHLQGGWCGRLGSIVPPLPLGGEGRGDEMTAAASCAVAPLTLPSPPNGGRRFVENSHHS